MTLVLFSFILLLSFANGGFTLSDKLTQCLHSEEMFISDLESYIEAQESVLQLMRKKLLNFKVEHSEAKENPEAYLANELSRFLFFKRLSSDINLLSNKTFEVASRFKSKVDSYKEEASYPTEDDLISSALSIAHLQRDKDLRTKKLAKGFFGNTKRRNGLSTEDCYQVGKQLNAAEVYSSAIEWLTEALGRYDEYYDQHQVNPVEILEELALSFMGNNQIEEAEKIVEKISRMNANSRIVKLFKSNDTLVDLSKKNFPSKIDDVSEGKKHCYLIHFLNTNIFTCPA